MYVIITIPTYHRTNTRKKLPPGKIVSRSKLIYLSTHSRYTKSINLRFQYIIHCIQSKMDKIYSSPGAASISCSTTTAPPFPRKARAALLLLLLLSLAGAGAAAVVVVAAAAAAAVTVGVGARVLSGRPSRMAVYVICVVVEQCQSRASIFDHRLSQTYSYLRPRAAAPGRPSP